MSNQKSLIVKNKRLNSFFIITGRSGLIIIILDNKQS
jgi:hypothetical protein